MTWRRRTHSDVAPVVLEVKEKVSRSCTHLTTSESRLEREGGMSGRGGSCKAGCPALGYGGVQTPREGGHWGLTPACVQPVSWQNAGQSRTDPSGSFSDITEDDLTQNITVLC